jgi:hypothetical protein
MHTGRFIFSELIAHLPHKQFQKCVARYDDGSQWRKFSYLKLPGYRSALPLIRTRYICGCAQPRARKLEFHPGGVVGEGRRQKLLARDWKFGGIGHDAFDSGGAESRRRQLWGGLARLIKLSGCVSDLLGLSSRRMLKALAEGERDATRLASLADPKLRAAPEQLQDALYAASTLSALHRQILGLFLTRLELVEHQIEVLDQSVGQALRAHQDAVLRLAEVPGYGVDSAQQVIAEVGPAAATFPSSEQLSSWVGTCPGREESAEVSKNNRSPKGNRMMRRVLNQVAHAAVKTKGSVFQALYRRFVIRLGHNKAIWAIAHRLCRLTWKILHQGVRYMEFGTRSNSKTAKARIDKLIRELRSLGYHVQLSQMATP